MCPRHERDLNISALSFVNTMTRALLAEKKTSRRPSATAAGGDEMRIAAIDVGSNSIHIMIAQVDAAGGLSVLWRDKEMVGLGRISFPSHRLSREAIERAM